MLANYNSRAVIAVKDIERARRWYEEKLELTPLREEAQGFVYQTGSSQFFLYQTGAAGTAQNTVAEWDVDDLDMVMAELRARGVVFEEYDYPDFKTINGVACSAANGQHGSGTARATFSRCPRRVKASPLRVAPAVPPSQDRASAGTRLASRVPTG